MRKTSERNRTQTRTFYIKILRGRSADECIEPNFIFIWSTARTLSTIEAQNTAPYFSSLGNDGRRNLCVSAKDFADELDGMDGSELIDAKIVSLLLNAPNDWVPAVQCKTLPLSYVRNLDQSFKRLSIIMEKNKFLVTERIRYTFEVQSVRTDPQPCSECTYIL